jgi:hypothetical protein
MELKELALLLDEKLNLDLSKKFNAENYWEALKDLAVRMDSAAFSETEQKSFAKLPAQKTVACDERVVGIRNVDFHNGLPGTTHFFGYGDNEQQAAKDYFERLGHYVAEERDRGMGPRELGFEVCRSKQHGIYKRFNFDSVDAAEDKAKWITNLNLLLRREPQNRR